MIVLCSKTPAEVTQTNTNLSGTKCIPNKPINGLYHKKILKRSVERTLDVTFPKALPTLGTEMCLKVVLRHSLSSGLAVPLAAWQELG